MSGSFYSRGERILRRTARVALAVAMGAIVQAGVVRDGGEYRLADELPGDQNKADLALGPQGGYLVWQDNIGDGDGLSVNFRRVSSALSGEFGATHLATR